MLGQNEVNPLLGAGAADKEKGRCTPKVIGAIGGVCCCCIYIILVVLLAVIANMKIASTSHGENYQVYNEDGVTKKNPQNVSSYEWWLSCQGGPNSDTFGPTSEVTNCGSECCNCKERDAFRKYNSKADYMEVRFPSRRGNDGQEVVELTAWWLPAHPTADKGAAIILVHGLRGSINDFRPALAAYLVRAAGFSVLMPNIRGHGASGTPKHGQMSWGWDYPYDVLGAWDYLVKDPDDKLGGPRSASKIGVMGFSMGGFIAATAFGLEHEAAALWLDGPVSEPKEILHTATAMLGLLAPVFNLFVVPPAWKLAELMAGVDMTHHSPEKCLPSGPKTKRPVMLVQSQDDSDVPKFMADFYVNMFNANEDRYDLSTMFELGGTCLSGGRKETHNMLQWLHPSKYRLKLCEFWSQALLKEECDESKLEPSYS